MKFSRVQFEQIKPFVENFDLEYLLLVGINCRFDFKYNDDGVHLVILKKE